MSCHFEHSSLHKYKIGQGNCHCLGHGHNQDQWVPDQTLGHQINII